jgi:hypothetical protein
MREGCFAVEKGLDEQELVLFDLLKKDELAKADGEKVKQASKELLASLSSLLAPLEQRTERANPGGGCDVHSRYAVHELANSTIR